MTVFWIDEDQVIEIKKYSLNGQTNKVSRATPMYWASGPFKNEVEILRLVFNDLPLSDRTLIQAVLEQKGYYGSVIDGLWGNRTSSAIRRYGIN